MHKSVSQDILCQSCRLAAIAMGALRSSHKSTSKAYALLYAIMLLLLIGFFLTSLRTSTGITLDRLTNSHIRFQETLYLQSLEQAAKLCHAAQIASGDFVLDDDYKGGFEIVGDRVFLYIEAINRRTGQILRSTKDIALP